MKRITLIFFCVFILNTLFAQDIILSEKAHISLLTCSPGTDIYNTFGHSAVRVKDPIQNIDVVFNYGTFSFGGSALKDQLNFGIEFARGKLNYYLSTSKFERFMNSYKEENRSVFEQILNLTAEEKQYLFDLLIENYQPENKYYQYDFFYDNCSSRIRDIVEKSLNYQLQFYENDAVLHGKSGVTFMEKLEPYIAPSPWLRLGIYFLLGYPANIDASLYHQMFLPDYLMQGFESGTINRNGLSAPLVADFKTLFLREDLKVQTPFYMHPLFLFGILALIVGGITLRNYNQNKHFFWIDYLVFSISGLLGILLVLMWFATDHSTTTWNFNLMWLLPTNIVALFLLKKPFMKYYFIFGWLLIMVILVFWIWFPQKMNIVFIPFMGILVFRYLKLTARLRN